MAIMAGRRLALLRKAGKVTQVKLAETLRVDQSAISKWETGDRMPDPYAMSEVAVRFRATLDYIYRGRLDAVSADLAVELTKAAPDLVVLPPKSTD